MSQTHPQLALFSAFNAHRVEYVVVGGTAVNAHGFVRGTRDLDIFIRPSIDNAKLAFAALASLGAPLDGLDPTDLLVDYEHFRYDAEFGPVDILADIGGLPFDQVWRSRVMVDLEGVPVPIIALDDLIAVKRLVGRNIDLIDADELQRIADAGIVQPIFRADDSKSE